MTAGLKEERGKNEEIKQQKEEQGNESRFPVENPTANGIGQKPEVHPIRKLDI
jgi:hypothetical protein